MLPSRDRSAGDYISDTGCIEECPYQLRHALDGAELRLDLRLQLFASPQWCSGHPGVFHVAPYHLIGVQFRRVAREQWRSRLTA
jgi:hypothetical protein